MVTKRIKIRSENGNAKVLRFGEAMPFGVLISRIVAKLEVTDFEHNHTLEEQFDLWLCDGRDGGNENLLEEMEEIDDGDLVILKKKKKKKSRATPASSEYNVVLPVTSGGLLLNLGEIAATGWTVFLGYRNHPDGTKGPAEVNNLIRHSGDRIISLDGESTIGKSFKQVCTMLKKRKKKQKFVHVRFLDARYMRFPDVQKRQADKGRDENNMVNNDDGVEDVTEQCLEARRSARVKQEKKAELVTSGDENDDGESSAPVDKKEGTGRKRKADSLGRRSRHSRG